jgi:hypothetical protein
MHNPILRTVVCFLVVAAAIVATFVVSSYVSATTSRPAARQYWGTAPQSATLPRPDAYCAARVQLAPERVAGNTVANHMVPPRGAKLRLGPWRLQDPVMARNFAKVTGNFKGTTDEILEWAACKWGWDQNALKAQAVAESTWNQKEAGDRDAHGFESWCILQVKVARPAPPTNDNAWGGYPWVSRSTAFCADMMAAWLRSVYTGHSYMGRSVYNNFWGTVSAWQSGYNSGADGYVREVQYYLRHQTWRTL